MKKYPWLSFGVLFFFCFVLWCQPARAQTYSTQPVQMIIPLSPGDTVDLAGRAIATEMSKILKTSVIIVNKPGGGGTMFPIQ